MDFNDAEFSRWEVTDNDEDHEPMWFNEYIPRDGSLTPKPHSKYLIKALQPIVRRPSVKRQSSYATELPHGHDSFNSMVSCLKQLCETKSTSSLEKIPLEVPLNTATTSKEALRPVIVIPSVEFDWASPMTLESPAALQPKDNTLPAAQPLHGHHKANRKTPQRRELRSLAIISCRATLPDGSCPEAEDTTRGHLPYLVEEEKCVEEQSQADHLSVLRSSPVLGALSPKKWANPDRSRHQAPLRSPSALPNNTPLIPKSSKRTVSTHMKASDLKLAAFRRLSDATEALRSTRSKRFDSRYALPAPTPQPFKGTTTIEGLAITANVS